LRRFACGGGAYLGEDVKDQDMPREDLLVCENQPATLIFCRVNGQSEIGWRGAFEC
jgi:hypothetical protein